MYHQQQHHLDYEYEPKTLAVAERSRMVADGEVVRQPYVLLHGDGAHEWLRAYPDRQNTTEDILVDLHDMR